MQHYIDTLRADLHEANDKNSQARKDKAELSAQLQETRVSTEASRKLLESQLEVVTADKDHLFEKVEDLTERLRDSRDSYGQVEESYRQEIRSKTKLADLHAEQAENAKEEILELQKAVEELQRIAREGAER